MSDQEILDKEAINTVVSFLKTNLSKSDALGIQEELKQNFVLAKRSNKVKRNKRTKKKKCLTRKDKNLLGFYNIPRNAVKYREVTYLNSLWSGYMEELLELDKGEIPTCPSKNWESFTQKIFKSDFHGSFLKIICSKCPSYVDKMGICIMDTRDTFKIVSKDNVITTIPKKGSVFELHLKNIKVTLFGKHLCIRPAERSTKKIKKHLHPDL